MTWFPLTRSLGQHALKSLYSLVSTLGEQVLLLVESVSLGVRKPWIYLAWGQAASLGWYTLGMGVLMSSCFGMVIALQVAKEMVKQGAGQYVGALVAMAVVRELGPLMTGFSAIAIAGSAFTAQLATMQLTQQMDALRVARVSPVRYLAVPRLASAVVMLPLVNILVSASGVVGGSLVALKYMPFHKYYASVCTQTSLADIGSSSVKAMVFGVLFATIAIHKGLGFKGTSADMVKVTTESVVYGFVAMALADGVISLILYG
jgi:phospholipid/cholesterol/gamma-HCH transport system permease protein